MPKEAVLTLAGVRMVSSSLRPLRLLSTCQVVMLTTGATAEMVAVVEPEMLLRAAVMVVEPEATPVAKPELLMVAMDMSELDQLAEALMSLVDPSE